MLPNANIKEIIPLAENPINQTADFFIACKESRIEKNTSFYGCFYLGPFDDSLSQTLANDLRRTLLSELTGLAITSIEIDGVLHKFSNLPGMKESVLDLICNIQNIVLKKDAHIDLLFKKENLAGAIYKNPKIFKKTFIGFLNVNGPRVIKAKDLKLPAGLQCVDPNQYIATLAEDGVLNMKFNINEGKNFIKQKPYNLNVNVLKKRNILLRQIVQTTDPLNVLDISMLRQQAEGKRKQFKKIKKRADISNPIPLDAVFMPVTKIHCIIEENNIYTDFSTDSFNIPNGYNSAIMGTNKKPNLSSNNGIIYQTIQILLPNNIKTNENFKYIPFMNTATLNTMHWRNVSKLLYFKAHNLNVFNEQLNLPKQLIEPKIKEEKHGSEKIKKLISTDNNRLDSTKLDNNLSGANVNIKNFSKIKTFLNTKLSSPITKDSASRIYLSQQNIRKSLQKNDIFAKKENKINQALLGQRCLSGMEYSLDYINVLKLKPLRKKSHLILEIWTNGSIHPRQALSQTFKFLTNNFLKLQNVKMLGSRLRSEMAYTNLKYSLLNNYITTIKKQELTLNNKMTGQNILTSFSEKPCNLSFLNAPLSILKISLRSYTILKKEGIFTINDLVMNSKKDLLKIKNFGVKSLYEIETNLSGLGLSLKN